MVKDLGAEPMEDGLNASRDLAHAVGGVREPTASEVEAGLAFIKALDMTERRAFLGLFAGARFPWTIYDNGEGPFIGKSECEWVEDWRGFYAERLPAAGLFFWEEIETGDALGMIRKPNGDYHTWIKVDCGPTRLGSRVREAWWDDWQRAIDAKALSAPTASPSSPNVTDPKKTTEGLNQ